MLRTYGNRPSQVPQKPKQPEFVPKERSKEELRQWQSTFNVISFLLKSHARQSTAASWAKIKRFWQIKKKYSTFLLNKLHLLQKRKARQYLKSSLSAFQSNRINFYTNKKAENIKLKQNLKNKSTALIVIIATKLQKAKVRSYFQELRIRSQLKAKLGTFKNTHLFSRLSSLYLTKLRDTFNKINIFGKYKLKKVRNLSRIEKLISTKTKAYLLYSIMKLKINVFVTKNKQALQKQQKAAQPQTKTTPRKPVPQQKPQVQPNNDKQLEQEIRKLQNEEKTLNQKKKNLERDLNKLETDSQKTLNDFRKEIERLQRQNSQLVFNNDLLEQNNQELQREYQNKQRTSRKKLSRAQIWQNVYNNLMHFLTINKDKQITKAALLQCLELPLVPCNINVDQLKDQNQILSELLEQYKKNFPPPQVTEAQIEPLPFEIIRKQNRYYYMVLQVLSEWGTNGSKQLQQLNKDLTSLQKKLGS